MSNELAKPAENKLLHFLAKYKGQIEGSLARQIDPKRYGRLIMGALNKTPELLNCTPFSVLNCVMTAASMGLEIRTNQAYLIPIRNRREERVDCNLWIDYRGKIDLAKRSGLVDDIEARLVYAADEFDCEFGANPVFKHRPALVKQNGHGWEPVEDRGQVVLGYAIAWIKGGRCHIEPMTKAEIEAVRARSKSGNSGPWVTDWNQMARKTLIHRICNYIPQSPELALSQDVDDRMDTEVPLDPVIELIDPEDDEKPLVETGKEEQGEALKKQLIASGTPEEAAEAFRLQREEQEKERARKVKHKPINGIPVLNEFPEMNTVGDGQKFYIHEDGKNTLYGYVEERSAFVKVSGA